MQLNSPETRLLKTKLFSEQLIIKRNKDTWDPPLSQPIPLDQAINEWVDRTGNELVSVSTPGMYMQWMDAERVTRLIMTTVMAMYIPAVKITKLVEKESNGS